MRRGSIVQLVAIGIVFGAAATAAALFVPWLPDPASRQAGRIDFVFWFVTAICIAIFALVAAVIVYSLVKFRVRVLDSALATSARRRRSTPRRRFASAC